MGVEAALMLGPVITAAVYGESAVSFLLTMAIAAVLAVLLTLPKLKHGDIYAREGFVSVALSWLLMSLVGALPFVFSGEIPSYVDAFFEIVSGFTTTGASILTEVESLSRGILFWRSFTHWVGGMGVLVFVMTVIPLGDSRSMHIMRAEVPGPIVGCWPFCWRHFFCSSCLGWIKRLGKITIAGARRTPIPLPRITPSGI